MKYHEKSDTSRFMISLLFATIFVVLVIVTPVTKLYKLLGIF
jgi:hypothetical protein